MRLGTAIECLVDNYKYASDKEWINDKVAWALCHTWKEADRKTEPTSSKMEQVEDEPMKTTDYCDICKRDMCEVCVADATNPYCVPSHYEINYEPKDVPHDLDDVGEASKTDTRLVVMKEVADRPKGEWIVIRKGYDITLVSCSNCGKRFRIPNYNFKSERTRWKCCPICCADMKGADNDI